MTVHFIGAGPGAADLITLRGAKLLASCPVCLHAGSIVAPELLQHCAGAEQCCAGAGDGKGGCFRDRWRAGEVLREIGMA